MFCTACGTENLPGSHFCANCGAALPVAASGTDVTSAIGPAGSVPDVDSEFSAEAHQGAVDALTPGSALLVVKRGPNAGSRFLLDQDVTSAGRHPDSDIFLDDVTVSRRHAEFRREGSGYSGGGNREGGNRREGGNAGGGFRDFSGKRREDRSSGNAGGERRRRF